MHTLKTSVYNSAIRPILSSPESLNDCSPTRWHNDSAVCEYIPVRETALHSLLRYRNQGSTEQKLKGVKSLYGSSNSATKLPLFCVV